MNLSVLSGKNLNPKDSNGLSDPYVIVQHIYADPLFAHHSPELMARTPHVKKTLNPTWDHSIDLIALPGDSIKFLVYDHDLLSKDDFMGSATLLISSIVTSPTQLTLELFEHQTPAGSLEIAFTIK